MTTAELPILVIIASCDYQGTWADYPWNRTPRASHVSTWEKAVVAVLRLGWWGNFAGSVLWLLLWLLLYHIDRALHNYLARLFTCCACWPCYW